MLLRQIRQAGVGVLAVAGLAKNVGKTATMNVIARQATGQGLTLGLTSLGFDGEAADRLTAQDKPRIRVEPGTLIATAHDTLKEATAALELLQVTPYSTPLGPVVLARVREAGRVLLAGPVGLKPLADSAALLKEYGAQLVLIDGALNRLGAAASSVSEAMILATGGAVAATEEQVVARTLHTLSLLRAPAPPEALKVPAEAAFLGQHIVFWQAERGESRPASLATALGQPEQVLSQLKDATHLLLPGALSDHFLGALLEGTPPRQALPQLVVPSGTHVFVSPALWQRYLRRGGRLYALYPASVLAVTVNPGQAFGLGARLAAALHPLPVYDLFLDEIKPIPASGLKN